jgi:hypothetical protein
MLKLIMKLIRITFNNLINLFLFKDAKNTSLNKNTNNLNLEVIDDTLNIDFKNIKKINLKNLKMVEFDSNFILKTNGHLIFDSNAFSTNNKTKVIINPDLKIDIDTDIDEYVKQLIIQNEILQSKLNKKPLLVKETIINNIPPVNEKKFNIDKILVKRE